MFPMYCLYREVFSPKCAPGSSVGLQWHYLSGRREKSPEVSRPSEPGSPQNSSTTALLAVLHGPWSVVRGPPWSARKGRFAAEIGTDNYCTVLYCIVLYSTVLYCSVRAVPCCTVLYST